MTSASCLKPMIIDLNIGDQLTSISCGHVVVEVIKFIVYQRLQIPYSYQWLKQVITKKKECQEKKDSFQSERHFRIASTALENLDLILKSLLKEIDGASIPEEVCVALGATPMTCKEMYKFLLPSVCHKPQCHSTNIANDQKIQRNVFKTLVTSEKLSKILFDTLPPTNMYVFMKKKAESNVVCDESFVSTAGCRVPRSAKIIVLDLNSAVNKNLSCCNDFQVFGDVIHDDLVNLKLQETDEIVDNFNEIESNEKSTWFQSNYIMKGFKDCIVNGNSVTSTWLES